MVKVEKFDQCVSLWVVSSEGRIVMIRFIVVYVSRIERLYGRLLVGKNGSCSIGVLCLCGVLFGRFVIVVRVMQVSFNWIQKLLGIRFFWNSRNRLVSVVLRLKLSEVLVVIQLVEVWEFLFVISLFMQVVLVVDVRVVLMLSNRCVMLSVFRCGQSVIIRVVIIDSSSVMMIGGLCLI